MTHQDIIDILGANAEHLLSHSCNKITALQIYQPNPQRVDDIFKNSDRSKTVIKNLQRLYNQGQLGNTGYLSIFPVDQGVEHTAGYSFAHNPDHFDPENIVRLAVHAQCSAVASTLGALGLIAKKYAAKIPLIVKLNHNECLTYPLEYDQVMFAQVKQAYDMGATGVGATIFFGSPHSRRQIVEVSQAFYQAHQLGMFTILWCYPRNLHWRKEQTNYETAADVTGQANYLGVTLEADIIKQKLPSLENSFQKLDFAKHSPAMYQNLLTSHPIDMVRYQVLNCYAGKISLLNSGGGSTGQDDLTDAITTAVINKRGGGSGLIMGRKVFNRSFDKGVALIKAVQDVYLDDQITLA